MRRALDAGHLGGRLLARGGLDAGHEARREQEHQPAAAQELAAALAVGVEGVEGHGAPPEGGGQDRPRQRRAPQDGASRVRGGVGGTRGRGGRGSGLQGAGRARAAGSGQRGGGAGRRARGAASRGGSRRQTARVRIRAARARDRVLESAPTGRKVLKLFVPVAGFPGSWDPSGGRTRPEGSCRPLPRLPLVPAHPSGPSAPGLEARVVDPSPGGPPRPPHPDSTP